STKLGCDFSLMCIPVFSLSPVSRSRRTLNTKLTFGFANISASGDLANPDRESAHTGQPSPLNLQFTLIGTLRHFDPPALPVDRLSGPTARWAFPNRLVDMPRLWDENWNVRSIHPDPRD